MKSNFYISFGVWITILPFLGIPGTWRNTLVFLSGIFFILVSVGPIILKKLETGPKSEANNELKFSNNPLNPPYNKGEKEEIE